MTEIKWRFVHKDIYPEAVSFPQLLEWHLYWGTIPKCSKTEKNAFIRLTSRAREFHGTTKRSKDDEYYGRQLRSWRDGVRPSEWVVKNIYRVLFGGDDNLSDWKSDMENALAKMQEGETGDKSGSNPAPSTDEARSNSVQWPNAANAATLPEDIQSIRGEVQHFADTQTEHSEMLRFLVASEMARRGDEIAKSGVADVAVVRLARRISDKVENPEHALAELGAALDELLQLRADAQRGSNFDTDIEAILRRIDERAKAGRFEDADREAERAFRDWERRETDRREREVTIGILFAEESIRTKRFLRDAEGVALWIAKRAAIRAGLFVIGYAALSDEIDQYIDNGRDHGINIDLEIAIALSKIAQSNAVDVQEQAASHYALGTALRFLGERQEGTASLDAAVTAFHSALEGYTPADLPLEWAMAQNNLGNALRSLGERQEGTASLEAAVAAFYSALEVRTRTDMPVQWAMTQNNLGNALAVLGERQQGTASLDAAVAAYRSALEVYTRADLPVQWSTTQSNLGNALMGLGQRQEGTVSLDAAVTAYRSALQVRTQASLPLDWAMTQNNLGNALQVMGEREEGTASLDAAVAAYHSALEVYTRADLPFQWAATQNNLGNALRTIGERQEGTASLDAAVAAFHSALEVYTRANLPLDWAITQSNLGNALRTLGERQESTASLDAAVVAFHSALEVHTRANLPLDWAITQSNLGNALRTLGERQEGTTLLEAAVAAFRSALEVRTRSDLPLDWAITQNNLGLALCRLGERQEGTASLDAAAAAYRLALEVFTRANMPVEWERTQRNLKHVHMILKSKRE